MTHFPNQPGPKDTRTGESTLTSDAHDLLTPQRCENGVHADWAVTAAVAAVTAKTLAEVA